MNTSKSKALGKKSGIKFGGVTNDSSGTRLLRGKERESAVRKLKEAGHIK